MTLPRAMRAYQLYVRSSSSVPLAGRAKLRVHHRRWIEVPAERRLLKRLLRREMWYLLAVYDYLFRAACLVELRNESLARRRLRSG